MKKLWLLEGLFLLCMLQICLLPGLIGETYADPTRRQEHRVTYARHSLEWDSQTEIDGNGAARLEFFQSEYPHIKAEDGERLLAPGSGESRVVRLKNAQKGKIQYTAVLYELGEQSTVPAEIHLSGADFQDAQEEMLPDGIRKESVIRAVTGELPGGESQEFQVGWSWIFEDAEETEEKNERDTRLGNEASDGSPEELQLGFYLTVVDQNRTAGTSASQTAASIQTAVSPQTGDAGWMGWFAAACLSAMMFAVGWSGFRKRKKT